VKIKLGLIKELFLLRIKLRMTKKFRNSAVKSKNITLILTIHKMAKHRRYFNQQQDLIIKAYFNNSIKIPLKHNKVMHSSLNHIYNHLIYIWEVIIIRAISIKCNKMHNNRCSIKRKILHK
jgi:hypothetical protein